MRRENDMTYYELFTKAENLLNRNQITLGEYEEMVKPLNEEIRKEGHWIKHIDDIFPADSTIECSVCHEEQYTTIDDNFCPNCGAKMEERR